MLTKASLTLPIRPLSSSKPRRWIGGVGGSRGARSWSVLRWAPIAEACWPGVTHVAQLTRSRTEKGQTTVEVAYLIAILPPGLDGPPSLLTLSRRHWGIENSLHYVRDVTFAEDRSRIRTGHAPQLLAACRNLAITLIHRVFLFSHCRFTPLVFFSSPHGF